MADANVMELTAGNFGKEVLESKTPVIVDFWAAWCTPCRVMAPVFAGLADQFAGKIKFAKLNVDDHPDVASSHRIMNIPTLLVFQNGEVREKLIGMRSAESIAELLNKMI